MWYISVAVILRLMKEEMMTADEELKMRTITNAFRPDKKLDFQVDAMTAGWMYVRITVDGETFLQSFDEAFDRVIDLVEVYIAVRDYGKDKVSPYWKDDKISWYWNDENEINLDVFRLSDDCFRLHIKVRFYEGEPEFFEKTVDFRKKELLNILDDFFRQVLANKGFPLQYPFGCDGHDDDNDELAEKSAALAEEILALFPEDMRKDDKLCFELEAICANAIEKLTPEAQEQVDQYRKMLETHELPDYIRW